MTTYLKFEIGTLTAEFEVDYRIQGGSSGGYSRACGWEPDEPAEVEVESFKLYELRNAQGNEILLDSDRAKKVENFIWNNNEASIDETLYEKGIDYHG